MFNTGIEIISIGIVALIIYVLVVLWVRKWLIKKQVSCLIRNSFLAVFFAPGLILLGEHAGLPIPSFAWMSAASNIYNCMDHDLFCSFELNLYMVILPFMATWVFAYLMCQDKAKENN